MDVALGADAPLVRVSVPDKPALAAAEKLIRDLFKVEFANKKPAERAEFAKKLLAQAVETGNDPASQYVLLDQSMSIAVVLGEAETALRASEQMARRFKVDGVAHRESVLSDLSRTIRTPEGAQMLVGATMELLNRAMDADDYDTARRMATIGLAAAKRAQNVQVAADLQTRMRQIDQLKKDYEGIKGAIATLATDPNDKTANLAMGKYLAFGKGEFDAALPYFAKGSDETLASLARRDLAKPTAPEAQLKLADAWWEASEKEKDLVKAHFVSQARVWYLAALPELKGLAKTAVEQKLKATEGVGVGGNQRGLQALLRGRYRIDWSSGSFCSDVVFGANASWTATERGATIKGTWEHQGNTVVVTYNGGNERIYVNLQALDANGTPVENMHVASKAITKGVLKPMF